MAGMPQRGGEWGLAAVYVLLCCAGTGAFLPSQNPPWPATWNMSLSTLSMACNSSGWFDPKLGGLFGIISYDWSNAKAQWANEKPMDCEERMITQAEMTKKFNPAAHVFVYRNLVKALPWMTTVREKLTDPQYSGFFLRFKPNTTYHVPDCTADKCSVIYHDQEQTPQHPHGDGSCVDECDCGEGIPCGEYLWDHRNGSMLRDFLLQEHILGPMAVGHPAVDGLFIDDFWCSNLINHTCTDPVQGPTEINKYSQLDMGLSDEDIRDLTNEWLTTMTATQQALVDHNAYTWSLLPGNQNANAMPLMISQAKCAATVRPSCSASNPFVDHPLLFGLSLGNETHRLPFITQEVAAFLLMRGDYAYAGAGIWGMSWPAGVAWDKKRPTLKRPAALDVDYGVASAPCTEQKPGVFVRQFTKSTVTLDCGTYTGTITMYPSGAQ